MAISKLFDTKVHPWSMTMDMMIMRGIYMIVSCAEKEGIVPAYVLLTTR